MALPIADTCQGMRVPNAREKRSGMSDSTCSTMIVSSPSSTPSALVSCVTPASASSSERAAAMP